MSDTTVMPRTPRFVDNFFVSKELVDPLDLGGVVLSTVKVKKLTVGTYRRAAADSERTEILDLSRHSCTPRHATSS